MTKFQRIALIGLGQMGLPMAENLRAGGFPVVGYDAMVEARANAESRGLPTADSLVDALDNADVVITMLPNGKIVQDVLLGGDVFRHAKAGALLLEMSSSEPGHTIALKEKVSPHLQVIDAPVSGGVKRAISGELTIMVGGDAEVVEVVRPVLDCIGARNIHCGPVGAGHAMKAINNFLSGSGVVAAIEAIRLGSAFGLSPDTMTDVLNASSGKNNATDVKMKQFILSGTFGSGFALGLMAKDIAIAARLADQLGLDLPNLRQTSEVWSQAAETLGGAADHTRIYEYLTRF